MVFRATGELVEVDGNAPSQIMVLKMVMHDGFLGKGHAVEWN